MTRAEHIQRELKRMLPLLARDASVARVIVFGSAARGNEGEASDIDMVVVQDTSLPFWDRLRETRRQLMPNIGLDLLVYTPGEFRSMQEHRPFVREEIALKGRTLYERRA